MQNFVLIHSLLSVVLVLQTTSAFPAPRIRRDVENKLGLSAEGEEKRSNLTIYAFEEMLNLAKTTVDSHKNVFEAVLKQANESELKSESLTKHLQKFSNIVDRASKLPKPKDEEAVIELFDLFTESSNLTDAYDDIENPSEEEKLIQQLLQENNAADLAIQFVVNFVHLTDNYEKHIQEYVDSLSAEDILKEAKLLEWFDRFKATNGYEESVDVTLEIFDLLGEDEESNESKE